jgi:hypothetical protein
MSGTAQKQKNWVLDLDNHFMGTTVMCPIILPSECTTEESFFMQHVWFCGSGVSLEKKRQYSDGTWKTEVHGLQFYYLCYIFF